MATMDLTEAWNETQARLPLGWTLDGLRCASTGLRPEERSDDWIAVAAGPDGERTEHRSSDPLAALAGLADSLASNRSDGVT